MKALELVGGAFLPLSFPAKSDVKGLYSQAFGRGNFVHLIVLGCEPSVVI
jgi:hypothetical protein